MIKISVSIDDEQWKEHILQPSQWARQCAKTLLAAIEHQNFNATVLLSHDGRIRSLNKQFRQQDKATNVLSFPSMDLKYTGDIILAFETCAAEAQSKSLPLIHHASHLLIHGILHLLGYDHGNDHEACVMEGIETKVLNQLGIADPYETTQ